MACVENVPPASGNAESEMEEGEIVDDLEDISDISSEEEFLLRERLQVLENYNNVLERKKAKRTTIFSGIHHHKKDNELLPELSEISATEFDDGLTHPTYSNIRIRKMKSQTKVKRKKELTYRNKDHKKKVHRNKKRSEIKIISETSDESEDEYRSKRKKLADAVVVSNNVKIDKSSLSARLKKMLHNSIPKVPQTPISKLTNTENETKDGDPLSLVSSVNADNSELIQDEGLMQSKIENPKVSELIDLCTDDDVTVTSNDQETVNQGAIVINEQNNKESDEDDEIELLRQHALKTKSVKPKQNSHQENGNRIQSEDEDSDTTELRQICLKSALLKKAIEIKQKQKLRKRLSSGSIQSSNLVKGLLYDQKLFPNMVDTGNDTDIESVDMDIGSDGEEKSRNYYNNSVKGKNVEHNKNIVKNIPKVVKIDELEDDEDLLRAKLLTSLSNNLSNLVKPSLFRTLDDGKSVQYEIPQEKLQNANVPPPKALLKNVPQMKLPVNNMPPRNVQPKKVPQEKPFIINLGESDSEDEHEATKNLTKMHMKLSEQPDFQHKLDMFLKSTRMEVEKSTHPDVAQGPNDSEKPEKFVAKTVKHLPKSEQIEYKNLVRRMAELEKIKQTRQIPMQIDNKSSVIGKDTLRPKNYSVDTSKLIAVKNVDEKIALSRKRIAVESSKMLKLKEEATKLTQKYKIVATELKNISTAISLNKKQQKSVHNFLSKIRIQHQKLLKSSTSESHSKVPLFLHPQINRVINTSNLQKENEPLKEDYRHTENLQGVKISVSNDLMDERIPPNARLSVQVDVLSNRKVVHLPKVPVKDTLTENDLMDYNDNNCRNRIDIPKSFVDNKRDASRPVVEKGGGKRRYSSDMAAMYNITEDKFGVNINDYKSPLQALNATNWEADPNAILCPFDVGGECKDPDCKYLHTQISTH